MRCSTPPTPGGYAQPALRVFGPPLSYHEGRRVVGMPDGDVLVLANYLDVNVGQFSWLGRFAGG